jgi:hypothetical protein
MNRSLWRWVPLWCYLALAVCAVGYAVAWGEFDPGNSELAGVPLIVLGLPWSFMCHTFNPKIIASEYYNAVLTSMIWIAVNVALIVVSS